MKTMEKKTISIKSKDVRKRLDIFVAEFFLLTRNKAQKIIKQGSVFINGKSVLKNGYILEQGDKVRFNEDAQIEKEEKESDLSLLKETAPILILKETDDYLVIQKPSGCIVHAPTGKEEDNFSVVSWLLKKYPKLHSVGDSSMRPGIVHRLDKDVSGVMVIAKNQKMFDHLKKQFKERNIEKKYIALVHGTVPVDEKTIDFPIDRSKNGTMASRPKIKKVTLKNVASLQKGKSAITHISVKKRYARYSLLEVRIETGRTHQIRVHLLAYNHPIVGDALYKNKKYIKNKDFDIPRIFLHATDLCFFDLKNNKICTHSDPPSVLGDFLKSLS